jgi:hypothetical protein
MTFKEFLEFISQSPNHFLGFLIVLSIVAGTLNTIFKYLFKRNKL